MKKCLILFTLLFVFAEFTFSQIPVNAPDIVQSNPVGSTVEIPISVGNLTGSNVIAYQFTLTFDNTILTPADPFFIKVGTISQASGWTVLANPNVSGQITIGAFGANPLAGSGVLLKLKFTVNSANGSTPLNFQSFLFNAGTPAAITTNGSFTNQDCSTIQTLIIPEGWSGISAYVDPSNPDMVAMFQSAVSNLIIVKNFTNSYAPSLGINPVQPWDANSGYFIKTNDLTVLEICGNMIQDKTVNLTPGWNLVPVKTQELSFVDEVMIGLDFEIVQEAATPFVYWPTWEIQTLYFFEPGKSYLIKMNSAGTLVFP